MRYDKHGEELSPTLQVFAPGETLPTPHAPAAPRRFERGNGPLDNALPPLRRQVGRRVFEYGK